MDLQLIDHDLLREREQDMPALTVRNASATDAQPGAAGAQLYERAQAILTSREQTPNYNNLGDALAEAEEELPRGETEVTPEKQAARAIIDSLRPGGERLSPSQERLMVCNVMGAHVARQLGPSATQEEYLTAVEILLATKTW